MRRFSPLMDNGWLKTANDSGVAIIMNIATKIGGTERIDGTSSG